jgi:hypothetical protein
MGKCINTGFVALTVGVIFSVSLAAGVWMTSSSAQSGTITVLAPNGGEAWPIGSVQTIRWSSTVVGDVQIRLNRGATSETIFSRVPNTGSIQWTVTGPTTSTALIRVISLANTAIKDDSDAPFSITNTPVPTLTVVSPNGREVWQAGTTQTIQWTSANLTGNVKIELSRDAGFTWATILNDTPNDGSEPWIVTGPDSAQCKIRLSSMTDSNVFDTSDDLFTITAADFITVNSPNGGEQWGINSVKEIAWSTNLRSGNVRIDLSRNGGSTFQTLLTVPVTNVRQIWTVTGPATTQAIIKLTSVEQPSVTDSSNGPFTITAGPSITVLAPNGGEQWAIGSRRTIQWSSINVSGNVKIELSRTGGTSWETILASTPNDGLESWTVTTPESTQCKIRMSSVDNGSVLDTSDGLFTIRVAAFINISFPSGDEDWLIGTAETIRWTSSNVTGNVKIELSRDGGQTYTETIAASTENDGSFAWTATSPKTTQAVIRISSLTDPSVSDRSFQPFKISVARVLSAMFSRKAVPQSESSEFRVEVEHAPGPVGTPVTVMIEHMNPDPHDLLRPSPGSAQQTKTILSPGPDLLVFSFMITVVYDPSQATQPYEFRGQFEYQAAVVETPGKMHPDSTGNRRKVRSLAPAHETEKVRSVAFTQDMDVMYAAGALINRVYWVGGDPLPAQAGNSFTLQIDLWWANLYQDQGYGHTVYVDTSQVSGGCVQMTGADNFNIPIAVPTDSGMMTFPIAGVSVDSTSGCSGPVTVGVEATVSYPIPNTICGPLDTKAELQVALSAPKIDSINPSRGLIGAAIARVIIEGERFGEVMPTVNVAGTGITATVVSNTDTRINVSFDISADAEPGNHGVTVRASGQTSNSVNFFVQVPKSLRRDSVGELVTLDPRPGDIVVCETDERNVCGAYRSLQYTLMDQDGPQQPIEAEDILVTETFSDYQGPRSTPPNMDGKTNDAGQLCDVIAIFTRPPDPCPRAGSSETFTQKFFVKIGSQTYNLTTENRITREKDARGMYNINVETKKP